MNDRIIFDDGVIRVVCTDQPDPNAGGACHEYAILCAALPGGVISTVSFQHGPIKEAGYNGVQAAHLLAILIDRIRHFQAGPFASTLNELVGSALLQAQALDAERTARRALAGVEGTSVKARGVEG